MTTAEAAAPARRSSLTLAAYATPCLPLAALGLPLVVFLPNFYSDELGLSLSAVAAAFGAVRFIDMAFDPFIGGVMDRTRTPFGRFRLWFTIGIPLIVAAAAMLFLAKPGVSAFYLWAGLLLVYAGTSITGLAHVAWATVLCPEYNQRSRIFGWWQGANVVGILLVLLLPTVIQQVLGGTNTDAIHAMGWTVVIFLPLATLLVLFKVPEPHPTQAAEKAGWREYFGLLARPIVGRVLIVDLLLGTGPAITGALFFFYFQAAKHFDKGQASVLLLIYFVAGLIGAPIWIRLAYKISKHRALVVAAVVYAVASASVVLMPVGQFLGAALVMFAAGIPYSASAFLLRAMMADVGDDERLRTEVDQTGLLYSMLTATVKIGSAASVLVTFPILQAMGYVPGHDVAAGSQAAIGLDIMFCAAPALLALVGAALIYGYPLTAAKHAEVRAKLASRDAEEAEAILGGEALTADEAHVPTAH